MAEKSEARAAAPHAVDAHYGRKDVGETILAGLRAAGKNLDALTPDDLAPVDHFHLRGKEATLELARRAGITRGLRVLDVGGGIGGAARTLASTFGCTVTVLDLTEEYCRVGETLTGLVGLSHLVTSRHGSSLAMPFEDGTFDLVWTEYSSMNVAEKEQLYSEIHRVLPSGGRLALHEIMAGPVQPIHFPVPWARDPAISFLRPPEEVRSLLARAGFREVEWVDVTHLAPRACGGGCGRVAAAWHSSPPRGRLRRDDRERSAEHRGAARESHSGGIRTPIP
jgi:SAM-dependent methyltransferase